MARRRKTTATTAAPAGEAVTTIRYSATRKHIPPAGLESHGMVREEPPVQYHHNPHLPPVLRSSPDAATADRLPELLAAARQRLLSEEEAKLIEDALRRHEPWLEWSGKRERPWFEVDPVALHMHERVSTQAILRVLAREDVHRDLFADPQLDYARAVQFYRHDVDWTNRMILGDSLQVMASLARREDLAGKVQMIYIDPPYGISFKSNFQPQLGQLGVKDREQDLTREPEMIKAYRDTWTLGIHSYLAYLRDRLAVARELLSDTGSIFVQISDENLHRIRCLLDEIFGTRNFVSQITIKKTTGSTADFIPGSCDYLLWYGKDKENTRFHGLYADKKPGEEGATGYSRVELPSGERRLLRREEFSSATGLPSDFSVYAGDNITSQSIGRDKGEGAASWFEVEVDGHKFTPGLRGRWKTNEEGMTRLLHADRLIGGNRMTLSYKRLLSDFPVTPLSNVWADTVGQNQLGGEKIYIVQTALKIVERCLLMTTDPGDLVLDPTCGSGTTAYVAEQWGRRWITIDTSRVALSLAKHRLMTASFEYYQLRELNADDVTRNPGGTWIAEVDAEGRATGKPMTFQCTTVPHIELRSIARNVSLDPIFAKHEAVLAEKLAALNRELAEVGDGLRAALVDKLIRKHREEGVGAVTDADTRRWLLPDAHPGRITSVPARKPFKGVTARQVERYRERIPKGEWKEWQVPFDTDPDWPESLQQAVTAYRAAWRAKMDEVNECIAANAATEELVDKPEVVKDAVRVAGPFSIEGVIAVEDGPDSPIGGAPEELDVFDADDTGEMAVTNAEAHLDKIIRLIKAAGVDFHDNKNMKFSRLEPVTGAALVHAEGEWMNGVDDERRVAVSIGPEVGNVTSMQVEDVIRSANRAGYDDVVFAGFGFDAAAQEAIESGSHPRLRLHMALIRPDVAMDDLLKTQPGSQLFTVFAAPRVHGPTRQESGDYIVGVEGMDVYDPVSGALYPTDRQRIAAWFLDTDYDGRTFCICQAFFPDWSKWDRLARALGDKGVVERGTLERLSGFESIAFPHPSRLADGGPWRVAVKVIDPRGNEGLRVLTVRR